MANPHPRYVIDTCSLVELRRRYPRDVFPGVWAKLGGLVEAGIVASVDEVFLELTRQDDEVSAWAQAHAYAFIPLDGAIQPIAIGIIHEYGERLLDVKRDKSGADPFVIAAAIAAGCCVVTEELASTAPNKVKIPNVCNDKGISCIPLLEMLRREGLCLGKQQLFCKFA